MGSDSDACGYLLREFGATQQESYRIIHLEKGDLERDAEMEDE